MRRINIDDVFCRAEIAAIRLRAAGNSLACPERIAAHIVENHPEFKAEPGLVLVSDKGVVTKRYKDGKIIKLFISPPAVPSAIQS